VQTLTENILRENLSPIEEAEAYQHIRTIRNFKKQQQLADYMGIDKRRISEKLALLELSEKIKQELLRHAGAVTASHARELMKIDSEELQLEVIKRVADKGLSVKETARIVGEIRNRMARPGKTEDDHTEFRRRIEEKKFIRRFDQLCRQLLHAAEIVNENDGKLKSAFRDTFGGEDNVVAELEKALRAVRQS